MRKVNIVCDETLKDNKGNGKLNLKVRKPSFLGSPSVYEILLENNVDNNIIKCVLRKDVGVGMYYKYTLNIDNAKNLLSVFYETKKNGKDYKYNLFENDLMLTVKIKQKMLKVLKEFDMLTWRMESNESTLIDVITDIIDLTEQNELVVENRRYSDIELANTIVKGFFNEVKENTEKIEF